MRLPILFFLLFMVQLAICWDIDRALDFVSNIGSKVTRFADVSMPAVSGFISLGREVGCLIRNCKEKDTMQSPMRDPIHDEMNAKIGNLDYKIEHLYSSIGNLNSSIGHLSSSLGHLNSTIGKLDTKVDKMDEKMDKIDEKMEKIDEKVDKIDEKVDKIDEKVDVIDERLVILDAKLVILDEKLDKMIQQIHDNYNSLKSSIVEHEFHTAFIHHAEVQFKLMHDIIKYKTEESITLFQKHFEKHHPTFNIMEITERLRYHNVTNPIVSAMHADPLRTTHTFEKWSICINNLYTTMYISYLFAQGLNGKDISESQQMIDKISEARDILESFFTNYKPHYWPHVVERLVRETSTDHDSLPAKVTMAITMKHSLEQIHTEDSFLIIVYSAGGPLQHPKPSPVTVSNDNQMIHQVRYYPNFSIIVLRSRTARNKSGSYLQDMISDVETLSEAGLHALPSVSQILFPNCSVAALDSNNFPITRTVGDYARTWWAQKNANEITAGKWHFYVVPH